MQISLNYSQNVAHKSTWSDEIQKQNNKQMKVRKPLFGSRERRGKGARKLKIFLLTCWCLACGVFVLFGSDLKVIRRREGLYLFYFLKFRGTQCFSLIGALNGHHGRAFRYFSKKLTYRTNFVLILSRWSILKPFKCLSKFLMDLFKS